ncbi:MAG: thiolase domain-containing protein [Candidatus Shapirobacteria bacterium]|jgi:acetyl-CoA C-acetyltransferase
MKTFVAGSYITKFGELWEKSLKDLLTEAVQGVIKNSNLDDKEVEAIFVSNMAGGIFDGQLHLGAMASQILKNQPPAMRIEGACASGGLAMIAAELALLSGRYKTVMVVGAEKMTDVSNPTATEGLVGAADVEMEYGSTFPGLYALMAQKHMKEFGTTRDELSAVSVKNHKHGLLNPLAQFHKEITIAEVNESEIIAAPLRLFDCSPISDGAAAVILTTKYGLNCPQIIGFGQGMDSLSLAKRNSLTTIEAGVKAAKIAYKMAGVGPDDIGAAEIHDCFSIAEILAIEDLGFFKKGMGGKATIEGKTTYGGKVVINPSGGLKSNGHPVGATGIKQIAYLSQLILDKKIKTGLAQNVGGSGATAVVHILGGKK